MWPAVGGALLLGAWGLTLLARRWNSGDHGLLYYGASSGAVMLGIAGSLAFLAGPWRSGLDPTSHVYPAIVWLLVAWTVVHVAVGLVMHLYCVGSRVAGRMTAAFDIDIRNVTLYWHFTMLTAAVTALVIAGFPLVA
jgi:cytochrome c oxidase subunit I+III